MSAIDQTTLHHTRAEIQGTVQFLFAEGATTRAEALAKGFTDLGNFLGMETKGEAAKTPVVKCYRGVSRESYNIPGLLKQGYDLQTAEVADSRKLKFALFGSPLDAFAQAALADVEIDALNFTAVQPAIQHAWYPLTRTGKQVRELTGLTIATLTEGVDFLVDYKLGLIRFIDAAKLPTAALKPKVSAPKIDASHPLGLRALKPMTKASWRGYGRILVWDQNDTQQLVMDHQNFSCEISLSSPFNIARDSISEMKLLVSIGDDTGEIYHRD